ncbi:beta-ketoacyl-[acyl-carrier-protein] synthase family protein [Undibacterium cyanobacteriorum]|uniref:Nodulation protein E n=1 Tax=Undibacterium cyanobacteriorum TaxID=3073561 RepID=A0ABY9RJY9_9BURK|nr:beta-ketoacyl-[acyl-carrier-protein] synthase family protein [Undibacterium sp. 20NA77.5]WMW81543.1 beta-ketoacyl-[acyl-carrier-protein] synthase family protein [Undibacterium sp. 20NA77.5]
MTERRVVVTGYGAVSAMGNSAQEIWDGILSYRVGYQKHRFDDPSIKAKFFSLMENDRKRYAAFPKAVVKMLPEFAKNALVASKEALDMAFGNSDHLHQHVASPFDIGAIIGTGWGGMDSVNYNNNDYRESGMSSSFATLMSMHSVATAAVSLNWNIRGYQNTPVAACATGTIAIGDAYHVIKSGRAKVMLAGGSESLKEQFNVWSIDVIQALSKEQEDPQLACCPFSAKRSGFVLAEGAAVICLEEYEHAKARGANILGEIIGYGNFSDAFDMTAPAEDLQARKMAITRAMEEAKLAPEQISYVNLHGTSTPINDVNETNSIKAAFGAAAAGIPMSSTKSYTGHLIGAAGSIETIFCLKAIETGVIPATVHLQENDPACDLNYTPNHHRELKTLDHVLNLSFGFGGANCALLIKRI